ncbi:MAG: formate hydrogenlyase [Thaumarchaeota archaeon]|nr:formate hydrogenlyase [Nitrososphaerota archaeon]
MLKTIFDYYPDRVSENNPDPAIREVALLLKQRPLSLFSRSIHVRMVDCGSSNDVELEEGLMMSPRVDAERFGVHFVASPRHADVLLATGPVTQNMRIALIKTYEAMAEPRAVVAAGDGACTGWPFKGSYALAGDGSVESTLHVDVKVPGNPPGPYRILAGILKAGMILDKKRKQM